MTAITQDGPRAGSPARPKFYFWTAIACIAVAVLGFAPTYFAPLARGAFVANPIVHIHGTVFFAWTLFFAYQTWLVSKGATPRHREVGLVGIALATAMTLLGVMVAIQSVHRVIPLGQVEAAKDFMIVPVWGIVTFAILVGLAIANVKRAEIHKRLMLVATASILEAAVARWFLTFLAPPTPPGAPPPVPMPEVALPPGLLVDFFIVAGIVHDWRTRGKPHPVYLIAGGAVLIEQIVRIPLARTPAWDAIATWLMGIMG